MKRFVQVATVGACLALLLALLAACSPSQSQSGGATTLTVATVNNSQMVQMEQLTHQVFEKQYPNIKVKFVTLRPAYESDTGCRHQRWKVRYRDYR